MKRTAVFFGLLAFVLLFSIVAPAVRADIVVGLPADPNWANRYPFGDSYSGTYEQVYAAAAFAGPITITALKFFDTQINPFASVTPSGIVTISLSTTSAGPSTLSSNPAANIGTDNRQVFSGNLSQPWAFGDTLTMTLSTPFTYYPSKGNLLMYVSAVTSLSGTNDVLFDENLNTSLLGRLYATNGNSANGYGTTADAGLVTGFVPSSVPIPGAIILLATGLAGLSVIRRRSKK